MHDTTFTTFSRHSLRLLGLGLGLAAALSACGGGGGGTGGSTGGSGTGGSTTTTTTSTTTSTTSTTTTSSTTTSSTTTSSTTTSSTTTSSTTTTPTGCTEITAGMFAKNTADGAVAVYVTTQTPGLGDMSEDDRLGLELYSDAAQGFDGETTGTFDLTMTGDDNYATCSRCLRVVEDPSVPGRVFFQSSGSLTIDAASDQMNGDISATLTDVTLVEVTIDSGTFESTPVPGGACLHLASASIMVTPPVVPAAWACDPTYYGDAVCDCGCGAFDDLDCADATLASCDYCDDPGSCSTMACSGNTEIDPANSGVCL